MEKEKKAKKSIFETPLLSTKIKTASVSLFPEAALGYLLGPVLALMANGVVNTYLVAYWKEVLGLQDWAPMFIWLLPLLSSILIIVGNLLVGKLIERKPTIAGKARPFLLIGMPLIAIALLVLFIIPFPKDATLEAPNALTLSMIAIGYNLYYAFAYPFYYTSHSSLVGLSTRDGSKRSLLATAQNASQLAASGLAGMVGPFLVTHLGLLPGDGKTLAPQDERMAANSKWVILIIILVICLVLGCLIEYFFTRERITEERVKMLMLNKKNGNQTKEAAPANKGITIKEQVKICTRDKYWWFIIIFFFLYQLGGMLKNNDALFYSKIFTGNTDLQGTINVVGAIPTGLGMLAIWPLCRKFGKANCIKIGCFFAFISSLLGFLVLGVSDNITAVYGISIAVFILKALGTVPAMYISLALLADVLDHQEALYGKRTDGFTMSVYGSIMVAMTGIANAIIIGLDTYFKANNPDGLKALHTTLFFTGEGVCYLIMGILFLFMNVEKFHNVDEKTIVEDQRKLAESKGEVYIAPKDRLLKEQEEAKKIAEGEAIADLKKKCDKKGLDFNKEFAAYTKEQEEKKKQADLKAQQKKAKKEEAERLKKAKEEQEEKDRIAALKAKCEKKNLNFETELANYNKEKQEKADLAKAKEAEKKAKQEKEEKKIEKEFAILKTKATEYMQAHNML